MTDRKTPMQMLGEIALASAAKRSEPTSKTNVARNAAGKWQFGLEVAHTDAYESAKIATEIADILDKRFPYETSEAK